MNFKKSAIKYVNSVIKPNKRKEKFERKCGRIESTYRNNSIISMFL